VGKQMEKLPLFRLPFLPPLSLSSFLSAFPPSLLPSLLSCFLPSLLPSSLSFLLSFTPSFLSFPSFLLSIFSFVSFLRILPVSRKAGNETEGRYPNKFTLAAK
jgi:hypothetical protein